MTLAEKTAINKDLKLLISIVNPKYVTVYHIPTNPGSIYSYKVHMHDIITYIDTNEKQAIKSDSIDFTVDILPGYPQTRPRVYFGDTKWLHHINRYNKLTHPMCTDRYDPRNSSLIEITKKTMRAIVFDIGVRRFNSMADSSVEKWQKDMETSGNLPTMNPAFLFVSKDSHRPYAK